jgi:MarR family transcriptional regulator, organic hydroperoxide resistance regulator
MRPKRLPRSASFRVLSLIHQANRQASLCIDTMLGDLNVVAQEGQLLAFVAARDGVPVTAVVRLLGVSKSTGTSLLQRLERGGFIRRRSNPQDARSALLFVTDKGSRIGVAARARVLELDRRIADRVSEADLRALVRVVNAVTTETGIDLTAEHPRRRKSHRGEDHGS